MVCRDLTCNGEQVATIYEKRWKVEEYHKSLKSKLGLTKSPSRTMTTQNNHVFMSIYGFFKLECLKIKHQLNHFALRAKLMIRATLVPMQNWLNFTLRNICYLGKMSIDFGIRIKKDAQIPNSQGSFVRTEKLFWFLNVGEQMFMDSPLRMTGVDTYLTGLLASP